MDSDAAWKAWGRTDPYFAVASVPEFRREHLSDNLDQFFAIGQDYVDDRLALADRLYGPLAHGRALDYGCGVGRLLIPLAGRFREVAGVDISEAMLTECRKNIDVRGIGNASLQTPGEDWPASGTFDFVNCYVVLQHIPVKRGMALIANLLELARPGGVVNIQVTIDRNDNPFQAGVYWVQRHVPGVQILVNAARGRRLGEPLAEMNEYPVPGVLRLFEAVGYRDVTVGVERQGRILSAQLLAQRLGSGLISSKPERAEAGRRAARTL